jgi:hypothetical protein
MSTPSILTRLKCKWQRIVRNRRSMADLAACPPSELHRLGQDVGVGDMDLRSLTCTHPGPSELMPRRLEQLGLDPEFVKHAWTATYRDMERVCGSCKDWRKCARDLAKGDVEAGMGSYCLNTPTIDAMTADRFDPRRAA